MYGFVATNPLYRRYYKISKGSSAPAAPDYTAAALAQGAANVETAKTQGVIGNPNINTPYGSQHVSFDATTGQPTIDQTLNPYSAAALNNILGAEQQASVLANQAVGKVSNAYNSQFNVPGSLQTSISGQPSVNTSTPSASNYNAQTSLPNAGGILGNPNLLAYGSASGNVSAGPIASVANPTAVVNQYDAGGPMASQINGAGDISNNVGNGQFGYASGLAGNQYGSAGSTVDRGAINQGPTTGQYGYTQQGVNGPSLQGQVNTSGIANMPVNAGTTGQAAIMSRLAPQIQQQDQAYAAQLANQGIVQGSEAYNNAMRVHNQGNNDLLTQAALQGINLDLSANQQGYGQALQSGQFANTAALSGFDASMQNANLYNAGLAQNYQQAINNQQANNSAQNLGYTQSMGQQQLANSAIGQNFSQGLQGQQLQNQATGQNYAQNIANQQAGNAAQAQQFGQNAAQAQFVNEAQAQRNSQNAAQAQIFNSAQAQNYQQQLAQQAALNAAQQQGYAQNFGNAQLNNAALAQNQSAGLASMQAANQAQQQIYNQNVGSGQFYNQGQQQNYNNQLGQQQAYNTAQNQSYSQGLAGAQFANTAQQQQLQEALLQRQLPMNELSALLTSSQIQTPQFQGYQPGQVAGTPIANAAQQQYNAQLQNVGMQNQMSANYNTGLATIGAATAPYWGPALAAAF